MSSSRGKKGRCIRVHLASALEIDPAALVVATWDRRLRDGVVAEHLAVAAATVTA